MRRHRATPRSDAPDRAVRCTVAALATLLAVAVAPSAAQERPGVGVLTFDNGGSYGRDAEDFEGLQLGLPMMLTSELGQNGALRLVERIRIRDLEKELSMEGVDARTAAEAGQIVGARYMILGSFVDLFGEMRLDARIVDVETSEVLATRSVEGDRETLYRLVVDLAQEITAGADLPPLPPAQVEERRDRDIPAEAIDLFNRAQVYADFGRHEDARETYLRILDEFPQMTVAREALEQLPG